MALLDDFTTRFPGFDTTTAISYVPAMESVWPCYYGGDYDLDCDKEVILNLVAHLVLMESSSSTAPNKLTSAQSVGDVSAAFAIPTSVDTTKEFFGSTKYGQRYLFLTSRNFGGVFV